MPDFNITTDERGNWHFSVGGQELHGITAVDISMRLKELPVVKLEMIALPNEVHIDKASVTAQQTMDLG